MQHGNFVALVYYAWFHRNEWKVFAQSDHKSGYLRFKVNPIVMINLLSFYSAICTHALIALINTLLHIQVGDGSVIQGLDEGVIGTCIGEGRRIIIPPEAGFGTTGSLDGSVPPNTTVIYDVQVMTNFLT